MGEGEVKSSKAITVFAPLTVLSGSQVVEHSKNVTSLSSNRSINILKASGMLIFSNRKLASLPYRLSTHRSA